MAFEIEKYFIELISKINDLGTTLTNSPGARNQLTAIKNDAEILRKRATVEYRRLALTESSFQERENYNEVLFDQSHQPIVVVDPEVGCFIDANRAAAKIFGYSSPQQ